MNKSIPSIPGPFQDTWRSLSHFRVPEWYINGKFGLFIHWGAYAVPAFGNEWYPRNMYLNGSKEWEHHRTEFGSHAEFGYKDFIPRFRAEAFDPDGWAGLFRRSGARFVVPVAEHHDGFAMYDSKLSDWTSAKMGPKRDIVGDLAEAVRRQHMVFGLSSHRAEHWWFFDGGMQIDSDVRDGKYAGLYAPAQPRDTQPNEEFLDDWLARCCELVDRYRPQLVWFDWWIEQPVFEPYLRRFAAYYYNRGHEWQRGVAINYKNRSFPGTAAVYDVERGLLGGIHPHFWQTDTSICNNSWGYVEEREYKSTEFVIGDLVDIVSKNGALLLNIGPKPDGTIPDEEQRVLLEIGDWFAVNGEAVYDSRPWKVYGEGPTRVDGGSFSDTKRKPYTGQDIRFTTRGRRLYAFILGKPASGKVTVRSLAQSLRLFEGRIGSVELLGLKEKLSWTHGSRGLRVSLPGGPFHFGTAVLKITPAE